MKTYSLLLGLALLLSVNHLQAQNDLVPDVTISTVDGKSMSIKNVIKEGKVTIIDFWATWCSPCKKELDNIMEVYPEWQKAYDVEVIAVSIDNARAAAQVGPMVKARGWDYTVLIDKNEDLKRALNVQSVPFTFIVDKKGKIVYSHSGYVDGDEFELEKHIKEAARK